MVKEVFSRNREIQHQSLQLKDPSSILSLRQNKRL